MDSLYSTDHLSRYSKRGKQVHIILIGDSILDNGSYVSAGESVFEILSREIPDAKITLLAVDGDTSTDVARHLEFFPEDATDVFISCGGNDALRSIGVLDKKVATVAEALDMLNVVREMFRSNYVLMLEGVLRLSKNVTVLTIYNKVPGISEGALTALALFNEIILEETSKRKIPIIDLRVICNARGDYSEVSPIEPSKNGGDKIAKAIAESV